MGQKERVMSPFRHCSLCMLEETACLLNEGNAWHKHKSTECVGLMSSGGLHHLNESLLCLWGVGPGSHISERKGQRLILDGWAVRSRLRGCKGHGVGSGGGREVGWRIRVPGWLHNCKLPLCPRIFLSRVNISGIIIHINQESNQSNSSIHCWKNRRIT